MDERPTEEQGEEARERFWAEYEAGLAAIRADPEANAALEAEDAVWDATVGDGLGEA